MPMNIFINLPVKNLDTTTTFFSALGFKFNAQFTDENATCMIINDTAYAMLLREEFYKTFITKDIADASKVSEVITALSVDSREAVDKLCQTAYDNGGAKYREPQDMEFMYSCAFQDPDGHLWEVFWMDQAHVEKPEK